MIIIVSLFFIAIYILYGPSLIKARRKKEAIIFSIILLLSLFYSLGVIYKWPLPNPTKRMEYLFAPLTKILENLLS